jgi:hypothetical protein
VIISTYFFLFLYVFMQVLIELLLIYGWWDALRFTVGGSVRDDVCFDFLLEGLVSNINTSLT